MQTSIADMSGLLEHSPEAVIVLDTQGRCIYLNAEAARLLGIAREEMQEKTLWEEGKPSRLRRAFEEALSPAPDPAALTLEERCPDTGACLSFRFHAMTDDSGTAAAAAAVVAVYVRDVTDARRAQEALREYEERYRSVIDNVKDVIFRTDGLGRWTQLNAAWENLLGYPTEESLGVLFFDFVHPDDRRTVLERMREALLARSDYCQADVRLRRRDGVSCWMEARVHGTYDEHGRLTGTFGILSDIDERRRVEEELRYVTTHARCLLWHGIVVRNDAAPTGHDWDIQMYDEAAASAFLPLDIRPGESYTDAWYRSRLDEERERTDANARAALSAGKAYYSQEFRCRRKDGDIRWLYEQAYIERVGAGRWRLAGVCTDITEQKRLEEQLIAAATKQRRIAENLQRSLLLKFPEDAFPGVRIATVYEPASDEAQVGGDFYDAVRVSDNRTAFIVGDVTGKGLQAASHTAEIKFTLRAFLREDPDPARVLSRLNAFLLGSQQWDMRPRSSLVAVSLAVLDTQTGEALCAAAGAEPPLALCANAAPNDEAMEIPIGGLPLGVDAGAEYEQHRFTLSSGDMVLLITDGITEAQRPTDAEGYRPASGRFFGYEGFTEAARRIYARQREDGEPPLLEAMGQAIVDAARDFAGGTLHDDACILLVRKE